MKCRPSGSIVWCLFQLRMYDSDFGGGYLVGKLSECGPTPGLSKEPTGASLRNGLCVATQPSAHAVPLQGSWLGSVGVQMTRFTAPGPTHE